MSDAFRDRMLEATKVVRGQERTLKRRIAGLYARCAQDMEKEILHYGEDTLTGRRAAELQKTMRGYVKGLWKEIHRTAEEAVQQGAALGIEAQASLLDDAVRGIRLSIRPSFKSMFARTQDEAVAAVLNGSIYSGPRTSLSRRIWNNEALQGGQIERLIAEATAKGRSATELARDLEAFVNPKAAMPDNWNDIYEQCPFPFRVDYNAKRLAVASLNHSYYQGMLMAARENPYAEYLHWELSSMHLIYDVCDTYMEHDEGLGLGNFSLDNAPLPHPFCRCLYYVDSSKSLSEIGDEIGRWISGEENSRLDGAFGEWKAALVPETAVAHSVNSSIMNLPDILVRHAVGARHVNDFPILSPDGEENIRLVDGEYIRNVKVFAGKGTSVRIRDAEDLEEYYGIAASEWQKVKGIANVEYDGEIHRAELHWYQADEIGRVEAKLKQQPDGGWWLDDR